MNPFEIDLSVIPTETLVAIKDNIKEELRKRRKERYINSRVERLYLLKPEHFRYKDIKAFIEKENSEMLLALPGHLLQIKDVKMRMRYFPMLYAQNWECLFPDANSTEKTCYVYAHVDPREDGFLLPCVNIVLRGLPFYIGKGSGFRAWDLKRNQGHGKKIQALRRTGFPDNDIVQVLAESLTEKEALILEAKLIYIFGSIYNEEAHGCLVNLADHTRPEFCGYMRRIPPRKSCGLVTIAQEK